MSQVISTSRRTDIPMRYPEWLSHAVARGFVDVPQPYSRSIRRVSLLPQDVHTLVLWSKDFRPLLADAGGCRRMLMRYEQVFCHITVTGLGSTPFEPNVAPWHDIVSQFPDLVDFAGDARRVALRFDPIVHWRDGSSVRSNVQLAGPIFRAASAVRIPTVRISFAALYGKVLRRGPRWHQPSVEERLEISTRLVRLAQSHGIMLQACSQRDLSQAGAVPSRCIDGALLSALHPKNAPAILVKDRGQRPECGCTTSIDIGAYTMRCPNGCLYCYANPWIGGRAESNAAST